MAAETEEDIVGGIEVVDTGASPCRMREVAESFLKGFDKQSQAQDFLSASS